MTERPSSTSIRIPDATEAHVGQETQYGMRFPDGSIQWDTIDCGSGKTVTIGLLVGEPNPTTVRWWDEYRDRKADHARIECAAYRDMHEIVKRTVVLAVTATEDV